MSSKDDSPRSTTGGEPPVEDTVSMLGRYIYDTSSLQDRLIQESTAFVVPVLETPDSSTAGHGQSRTEQVG
ncbi:hypothetical protein G7046_g6818 [Stylonectria norvegica]|nr:hypothetical protein G7046_g6818 [Stylonectria norvegica]